MTEYKLKPELIAKLLDFDVSARQDAPRRYRGIHRNRDDVLDQRLWQYYAKPRYTLRTSKCYGGNWATPWPPEGEPYVSRSSRPYYTDSFDGFRVIGDAHSVVRLDHTGWYMDPFCYISNLAVGVVLQMPARRVTSDNPREAIYIPAVRFTDSDGVTIFLLDPSENTTEAAYAADGYAESIAEKERGYQLKYARDQEVETLHMENKDSIQRVHLLKAGVQVVSSDIREAHPVLVDAAVKEIRSLRRSVHENIIRIKAIKEDENVLLMDQ